MIPNPPIVIQAESDLSQCSKLDNKEDEYVIPEYGVQKDKSVVISGCSEGGKSTLLGELSNRGFTCIPEPGIQIVKEQLSIGGDALPWKNLMRLSQKTESS